MGEVISQLSPLAAVSFIVIHNVPIDRRPILPNGGAVRLPFWYENLDVILKPVAAPEVPKIRENQI